MFRKRLLIDPDKVLFDVVTKDQFDRLLTNQFKMKLNSYLKSHNLIRNIKL